MVNPFWKFSILTRMSAIIKPNQWTEKKKGSNVQNPKCQKCLEVGHWTFQCKGKRKILHRSTRTSLLRKRLKAQEAALQTLMTDLGKEMSKAVVKKKKKKESNKSDDSDSDSSSSNSSSSSQSSLSDSDSDSSSSSSSTSSSSSSSTSSSSSSSSSTDKPSSGEE